MANRVNLSSDLSKAVSSLDSVLSKLTTVLGKFADNFEKGGGGKSVFQGSLGGEVIGGYIAGSMMRGNGMQKLMGISGYSFGEELYASMPRDLGTPGSTTVRYFLGKRGGLFGSELDDNGNFLGNTFYGNRKEVLSGLRTLYSTKMGIYNNFIPKNKDEEAKKEQEDQQTEVQCVCPECGYRNLEGVKFCQQCGAKLGLSNCKKCGAVLTPGTQFCGECGTKQEA